MADPTRLVARYRFAFEHATEKEMNHYLHLHPHADPKNHVVKKNDEHGSAEEDEHGEHGEHEEKEEVAVSNKQKVKNVFKGLSDKAKALVKNAPAVVQKFVVDAEHREKVMMDAAKSVLKSPKSYARNLVNTAKEEVHEFKEAGLAIKDVISGKKLNAHQKKAVKTVAIHMAITATAAALSTTGVFAGAAFIGKAMAKKVAMKAAVKALEKVHILGELHHISHEAIHGIVELMEKFAAEEEEEEEADDGELTPEEALAALVMKCLTDALAEFNEEDIGEALEDASEEKQKLAWKLTASTSSDLPKLLTEASAAIREVQAVLSHFDRLMLLSRHNASETGLPEDRVWQTSWVKYFTGVEHPLTILERLSDSLDDIYLDVPAQADVANDARGVLMLPRKAMITYAISDIDFAPNPDTGREGISYSVPVLKEWSKALDVWAKAALTKILGLTRISARW